MPSMSPVRPMAPQPAPLTRGNDIWPMKEEEGVAESGSVMAKPNWVLAPKKRSMGRPVAGSMKGSENWAADEVASSPLARSGRRIKRQPKYMSLWGVRGERLF